MAEKILDYLREHPGARKREIAGYLHIWLCDGFFMDVMHHLERANLIRYEVYRDPAQMEYYDKWYAVEE